MAQVMTDKEYITDILCSEKAACNLYNTAVIESANQVHQTFKTVLDHTYSTQHQVFNVMSQKGWYPIEPAEQSKVDQVKQQFAPNAQ